MKIKVTAKHIKLARKRLADKENSACDYCPIAIAAKQHLHKFVCVDDDSIEVSYLRRNSYGAFVESYRVYLPKKAKRFIRDFDNKKAVKPFTFETTK